MSTAVKDLTYIRSSVFLIIAAGSMESCIDTLSDVLHDYLVQMSQLLRAAVDNDASCVSQGAGGFSASYTNFCSFNSGS